MLMSKTHAPWRSELTSRELYRNNIYLHLDAITGEMERHYGEAPILLFVTTVFLWGIKGPDGVVCRIASRADIRIPELLARFQPIYIEFLKRLIGSHFNRPSKHHLQPPTYVFADVASTSYRKDIGEGRIAQNPHLHAVMVVPPVLNGKLSHILPSDNQFQLPRGFDSFVRNVHLTTFPTADLHGVTSYASKLMDIGDPRYESDELFSIYPVSRSEMNHKDGYRRQRAATLARAS